MASVIYSICHHCVLHFIVFFDVLAACTLRYHADGSGLCL